MVPDAETILYTASGYLKIILKQGMSRKLQVYGHVSEKIIFFIQFNVSFKIISAHMSRANQ